MRQWQRIIGAVPDGDFGPKTLELSKEATGDGAAIEPSSEYTQQPWRLTDQYGSRRLLDVEPGLARVVSAMAEQSRFRFSVYEGIRTVEKQREYVRTGRSWTMNSLHFKQSDGTSHAVDLVWRNDHNEWDWGNQECYEYLAHLGMEVAKEQGFPLRNLGIAKGYDWYHFERERGK